MSREWKPGDVAMVIAHRLDAVQRIAFRDCDGWVDDQGATWSDEAVLARPLVVIDPEDHEQVKRLGDALADAFAGRHPEVYEVAPDLADEDDDAITRQALRSLVNPPKPDEPQGLGAVVEDAEGSRWIRVWGRGVAAPWQGCPGDDEPDERRNYAAVAAVKVLSEGVTA